ncbi:MAG: hypothetical protein JRI22_22590 [Deltaproteobacteria bacterium]|nr:hypothetical protein [Deltaproteobacteria bacterium]
MVDNTRDIQETQSTADRVRRMAREMAAHDERHLRWALGVKVILLAFVVIYMGWAYSNFRLLDADLFVITAQQKFYESLPEAKARMADHLKRIAPSVVDQTGDEIVKNIPLLEKQIETAAQKILLELSGPLEKDFSAWLSGVVHESKAVLDDMFPGMTSYEKITRLRQYVLEDFQMVLESIGYEIGDALGGHSVRQQVKRLVVGKNLTEKEKLQRDILAIWYVLIRNKLSEMDLRELNALGSILDKDLLEDVATK